MTADVPPLEAAFIEMFSEKGISTGAAWFFPYHIDRSLTHCSTRRCMDGRRINITRWLCRPDVSAQGSPGLGGPWRAERR